MRRLIICAIFIGTLSGAGAKRILDIYESDGLTLFNHRNVRVGTELKLVVASDANDFWSGGVFISESDRNLATLTGWGYDPNTRDYSGCRLPDAGPDALVTRWEDSVIEGFDLFSGLYCTPGEWFEINYTALAPGNPNIGFYEYRSSWDDPNTSVTIHQVPAADFNLDGVVDLQDYSLLAYYWLADKCSPSDDCHLVDMDANGAIGLNDLLLFSEDWLWGIQEVSEPVGPVADPNLIYRIVDAGGFNEITIDVGQTVTLYVDMFTVDISEVWAFEVEANISDPNLGAIDNTAYDLINPPGDGTARILASPNRWTAFDRWGPGYQQQEGIVLSGICSDGAFEDGYLASFEFTCLGTGDVELSLMNWDTTSSSGEKLYPSLQGILIHQNDPYATQSMTLSAETTMTSMESTTDSQESSLSTEEMAQWLEDIWATEDEIQKTISEDRWVEFIESVRESD